MFLTTAGCDAAKIVFEFRSVLLTNAFYLIPLGEDWDEGK
jgi:hypothetical protein